MTACYCLRPTSAVILLATLGSVFLRGQGTSLSTEDIDRAIAWGQSGQPVSYTLRSAFPRAKTPPGVVYTPFLRVALAARFAREEERPFTAQDVTPDIVSSFIYIAMGERGDDPLPALVSEFPEGAALSMRLVTDHSRPSSPDRREIPPAWVRRDVPAFLKYGLEPDWTYLLAAFPLEAAKADTRVELYRQARKGGNIRILTKPGLITQADLSAWK